MVYRDDGSLEALIGELLQRVRVLETQAPVGFTAVSRGALRILSNEGLIVIGSSKVEGWSIVTGTERIVGLLEILGQLDLTGDMTVSGGGKIIAGAIEITPAVGGGSIKVGGHTINASGGSFAINTSYGHQVVINGGGVSMLAGGRSITVGTGGISMSGLPTIEAAYANGAVEGTIWQDTSGRLYRVIP